MPRDAAVTAAEASARRVHLEGTCWMEHDEEWMEFYGPLWSMVGESWVQSRGPGLVGPVSNTVLVLVVLALVMD